MVELTQHIDVCKTGMARAQWRLLNLGPRTSQGVIMVIKYILYYIYMMNIFYKCIITIYTVYYRNIFITNY